MRYLDGMVFNKVPLFITFVAGLCPVFGSLFNVWPFHIPALLVGLGCVMGFDMIKYGNSAGIIHYIQLFIILMVFQVLAGRGFAILSDGGYVIIFSFIFFAFFRFGDGLPSSSLVQGIIMIYAFYMIALLVEFFFVICGYQELFVSFLPSVNAPGYKAYNPADVLHFIGFKEVTGLNSLLLGSQIAGMLSLFSLIWFLSLHTYIPSYRLGKSTVLWVVLSAFLLLVTINLTVTILVLSAYVVNYLIHHKKIKIYQVAFLLVGIISVCVIIINTGIFDRILVNDDKVVDHLGGFENLRNSGADVATISSFSTREYYLYIQQLPLLNWLDQDLISKMIGASKESILNENVYRTGDFALGEILYVSGLVYFILFLSMVFSVCVSVLMYYKRFKSQLCDLNIWSEIAALNAVISLLFLLSLVHYPQATTNPGAYTLFSLHLAAAMYCKSRCEVALQ